jgi:hypothetical protein
VTTILKFSARSTKNSKFSIHRFAYGGKSAGKRHHKYNVNGAGAGAGPGAGPGAGGGGGRSESRSRSRAPDPHGNEARSFDRRPRHCPGTHDPSSVRARAGAETVGGSRSRSGGGEGQSRGHSGGGEGQSSSRSESRAARRARARCADTIFLSKILLILLRKLLAETA